ncbi:MAG: DUF3089 domain-containing protein [Firmicutes bacterium]|nr:DUF3089 domain-containing protein [Bacillota bacterium]
MKLWKRTAALILALVLALPSAVFAEDGTGSAPDYGDLSSWAYYALGEDTGVDVFLVCPTVDTRSETNSFDLNDKLKKQFVKALDLEKGIYEDAGRIFSPYYRQMSMNAYKLPAEEMQKAGELAYEDVSAAFSWYLKNENEGRAIILAGFSQGSAMCLELLKEYFSGEDSGSEYLRSRLVTVYALGWAVTEELTGEYPCIRPAQGELDLGTVVSFDCEDGTLKSSMIIPEGTKALSINPLNWRTDGIPADSSLNSGAVMAGGDPVPGLCGAYIGERGELVVTGVDTADYPPMIDIFETGSYHIYDYMFFFTDLKENLTARANLFKSGMPFEDVPQEAWYRDGVLSAYKNGLMDGTSVLTFSPGGLLTRAQLTTILWRMAKEPVVNFAMPYTDIPAESWYTEAVRWAAAEGIASVKSGAFLPAQPLTREEAVFMMSSCASLAGIDTAALENAYISGFTDAGDADERYVPALGWALKSGLIEGMGGGRLAPKGTLTRAQAAVMLERLQGIIASSAPLSLWTAGARARTELLDYVKAVTDLQSPDYIPEEDRIAVFDLDGTLFCETDPNYFDYTLLKYRVLEDPEYRDKASDFEKEVANKIREQNETGKSFPGLEVDHGRAVASAFAGMTVEEFNAYIQEFKKQPMPSYEGMNRGGGWYLPMLQVVDLLKKNGFTVYVVSGTDRLIVRGIACDSPLGLPNRQLIGSDETIVSSNQGEADGLNYVFADGDRLVLGGDFIIKNLKMNKVSVIMQEIGQQPVLSFGNSTGDSSMAEYVTYDNPYRSLAFMLCCDDTERENGNEAKAQKMKDLCEQFDWVPVSMRDDWTTIYGEGVTYKGASEELEPAA